MVGLGRMGGDMLGRLRAAGHTVSDFGEGGWTIKVAIDEAGPAPVLSTALYSRLRGEAEYADKLLSAMRFQCGGHQEKPAK
jgi:6-phosphogluconate dehydrogenase